MSAMGIERSEASIAVLDERLRRYDRPLFADAAVQASLRAAGFAVGAEPVLPPADVDALRALATEFVERLDEPSGELFLTTGRVTDRALRAEITNRTADLVLPRLRPHFVESAQLRGTALQIKPPSPRSELNPHQDSSLVDERVWLGVYAWIALDDTDPQNGGLHVLPGSHRYGNLQRTLNVPWQLAAYGDIMQRESIPLTVRSGTVVFFDAATVHWSPPNRSDRLRLACNSFVALEAAPMLHFFADAETTPGTVEAYEIDVSFFLHDDIMRRPEPPHRSLGEWPQHRIDWSADEFEAICRQAKADAGW